MSGTINKKSLRKQLFVDPKVQGALVGRVMLYWVTCLVGITLMLLCWRIVTGPARPFYLHFNEMWFFYGPALIASILEGSAANASSNPLTSARSSIAVSGAVPITVSRSVSESAAEGAPIARARR